MSDIEKILQNKAQIVQELYDWAQTFDNEVDDDDEPTTETLDYIRSLAEKLENNRCSPKDYEDILFHIWQINYNGEEVNENERYTNFPSKKFNQVAHVRPHAQNANDTYPLPFADKVTNAYQYTKHCFWLNSAYVRDEIYIK